MYSHCFPIIAHVILGDRFQIHTLATYYAYVRLKYNMGVSKLLFVETNMCQSRELWTGSRGAVS